MEVGKLYKFYGRYENVETLVGIFDGVDSTSGFLKFKDVCLLKYCDNSKPTIDHICREIGGTPGDWEHREECAKKIISEWKETNKAPKEVILRNEAQYNLNNTSAIFPMKSYFEEA